MHDVAVWHEDAIELLFGFGVAGEVHSPVGEKREHAQDILGHWPHATSDKFSNMGKRLIGNRKLNLIWAQTKTFCGHLGEAPACPSRK